MCVRLCRLRHCGGHAGQCQCEGERDCCCVHCVGSTEINGCAHGRHRPRACVAQGATPPCRWDGGGPPTRLPCRCVSGGGDRRPRPAGAHAAWCCCTARRR